MRRSQRVFAGSVAVVVLLAGVLAAMMLGPPGLQRTRRMDERRIADLTRIAAAVELHHARTGGLPADLGSLAEASGRALEIRDAATGIDYGYARTGDASYRLCAEFATDSSTEARARYVPPAEWAHAAGEHCYARVVPNGAPDVQR